MRARFDSRENWSNFLNYRPSVSASLRLTSLITAVREKRYNFPPRHYMGSRLRTQNPRDIFRIRYLSYSPPQFPCPPSLVSAISLIFPRQMCISRRIDSNSYPEWERVVRERENSISIFFLCSRSGSRTRLQDTRGCHKRFTLRLISIHLVTVYRMAKANERERERAGERERETAN